MRFTDDNLEALISDKDLKKAEAAAMLKSAEESEEFKKHMKSGGQHGIAFVNVGGETFSLNGDNSGLAAKSGAPRKGKSEESGKKYEANVGTMEFGCKCGQSHPFNPAHTGEASNPFAASYGANLSDKDSGIKTSDYRPGSASEDNAVRYLSQQQAGGDSIYLSGARKEEEEEEKSGYARRSGEKKKTY
ncbi:MAG: hypothetical protein AABW87_03230 [Nanoarchaeota archaeon]